MLLSNNPCT